VAFADGRSVHDVPSRSEPPDDLFEAALIESDRLSSVILWGPPGTGKTPLASVVAAQTRRQFVSLSAVTAGVKDVREVLEAARRRLAEEDRGHHPLPRFFFSALGSTPRRLWPLGRCVGYTGWGGV
jgi:KaiC/GvpD/RAD55 family RecA-like ATPase